MKENNKFFKDQNDEHTPDMGRVGETDSPYEILLEVDKILAARGLEVEMLSYNPSYYKAFRIVNKG